MSSYNFIKTYKIIENIYVLNVLYILSDANCKSHLCTFKYDIINVKPGTAHFRNVYYFIKIYAFFSLSDTDLKSRAHLNMTLLLTSHKKFLENFDAKCVLKAFLRCYETLGKTSVRLMASQRNNLRKKVSIFSVFNRTAVKSKQLRYE